MKNKYGNTFNQGAGESLSVSVVALWPRVDAFLPNGVSIAVDDTYTEGTKIPAGTPVEVDGTTVKIGSTATNPTGLTYEDAYVGNNGCTLTIVTNGLINESLSEASITAAQKKAVKGITFYKEA